MVGRPLKQWPESSLHPTLRPSTGTQESAGGERSPSSIAGLWPRSPVFWLAALWCALFIIRPWELLIPELKNIRFEFYYSALVSLIVLGTGSLRLKLSYPQTQGVVAFFLALAVSTMFALRPDLAKSALYVYFTAVVFYFILLSALKNGRDLFFFIGCYQVTMLLYLSKALWEYFLHSAGRTSMGVHRLRGIEGTFGHPNSLASSIVYSMPFWLLLWQTRKQFTELWSIPLQKAFGVLLAAYPVVAGISLILTYSRAGMLGMLLFVLLSVLRAGGRRRLQAAVVAGLLLSVAVLLMPADSRQRFESIWNPAAGQRGAQSSAEGRIEGLKAGIEMFKARPMTGIGVGGFIPYRGEFVDGARMDAHNMLGELLGETGLVGLFGFCALLRAILLGCRRIRQAASPGGVAEGREYLLFSATCSNTLVLLLFMGLFGHNLTRFNFLWLAAFTLVAEMTLASRRTPGRSITSAAPKRRLAVN